MNEPISLMSVEVLSINLSSPIHNPFRSNQSIMPRFIGTNVFLPNNEFYPLFHLTDSVESDQQESLKI